MAKRITLSNGKEFKTQRAALEHFRDMLHRYKNRDFIDVREDHADLVALLERYDETVTQENEATKIGIGIKRFSRDINTGSSGKKGDTGRFATPGFWVHRTDDTKTDFSFYAAIKGQPKGRPADFNDACRGAVHEDLYKAKVDFFLEHEDSEGCVTCEISGEPVTISEAHLDHAWPLFGQIITEFKAERGWISGIPDGVISESIDGQSAPTFIDETVREAFVAFHHSKAVLRVVHARENLKRRTIDQDPKVKHPIRLDLSSET